MKKRIIWSGLVFTVIFLICYFPMSSGREITEVARIGFGALVGFIGAVISWFIVNPEE